MGDEAKRPLEGTGTSAPKIAKAEIDKSHPSVKEVLNILETQPTYNLIPVYKEFTADLLTPVSAFLKVREASDSFLLESVEGGERIARYSFIGTNPYRVLKQNGVDPLVEIERELGSFKPFQVAGLPPFSGGGVGYIGYECVKYFEPTVPFAHQEDALQLPESIFLFCDHLIVFDRVKHIIKVVVHIRIPKDRSNFDGAEAYRAALSRIDATIQRLEGPLPAPPPRPEPNPKSEETLNVGPGGYENMVESLKQNIREGDIFQAVPSQRISKPLKNIRAFEIYRQLRMINPSPYMFFLDFGGFQVVGASPELLVKVEKGRVTNHPIAGTRPRGATPEEDDALAKELLADEKERAEHIMLVDLGRNDVGRVSAPGTVKVDSLMHIEKYSHVQHIVSNVSGELAADKTPYDAFRSCFPAGTVSGAPKIRAMKLVGKLEPCHRHLYAGAVCNIGFGPPRDAVLDTCIAIRTVVVKDRCAHMQAGGGIVFDSDAEFERQETINKMKALARAIDQAEAHALRPLARPTEPLDSAKYDPAWTKFDQFQKIDSISAYFGKFGGSFVPETLVEPLKELELGYVKAMKDPAFHKELQDLLRDFVGRPTPLYLCRRLTKRCGGARIWLKREDLCHTGAHKINAALASGLLAKRMGKHRIIAETGAGQHGVATATACAILGLDCVVYMGEEDIHRQALNVFKMKLLGADVVSVTNGTRTLKDAVNEAMRDWVTNVSTTLYLIGSVVGPHPFPTMIRDFQSIIGRETMRQMRQRMGKLPDAVIACCGGGSNAIGMFHEFIQHPETRLIGVEAEGNGFATGKHAASISGGSTGIIHGMKTYLLQDGDGQVTETHSISAGLDYPGVGPEHAYLKESGRAEYVSVTDEQSLEGMRELTEVEGVIPALESSHAVSYGIQLAKTLSKDQDVVINCSGRGDKDMPQVAKVLKHSLD